jgi:hypothetical protein
MSTANGHRQSVGRIDREGLVTEWHLQSDHASDLNLVRAAAAGHRNFHLRRAELDDLKTGDRQHREESATSLGESNERARIHAVKRRLERNQIRAAACHELACALSKLPEACWKGKSAGAGNPSRLDRTER